MTGLLDYSGSITALHRLHPLTKMALSFVLCAVLFISDSLFFAAFIIVFNLFLSAAAKVFSREIKIIFSLAKLSLIIFVLQVLFVRQGTVLLRLPFGLVVTDTGIVFSLLFVLRLIAVSMPVTLLLSITRVNDISNVLVRNLRLPYNYAFVITTALRFIPLFSDEMRGIMEAQIARGVEFDTRNFLKKIKLLLPLCVPLLISSVRKIEGAAISTELRGLNLRTRHSLYKQYRFSRYDVLVLAAALVLVAASFLL
jgi:energy-coupling factor transport system permease protein